MPSGSPATSASASIASSATARSGSGIPASFASTYTTGSTRREPGTIVSHTAPMMSARRSSSALRLDWDMLLLHAGAPLLDAGDRDLDQRGRAGSEGLGHRGRDRVRAARGPQAAHAQRFRQADEVDRRRRQVHADEPVRGLSLDDTVHALLA